MATEVPSRGGPIADRANSLLSPTHSLVVARRVDRAIPDRAEFVGEGVGLVARRRERRIADDEGLAQHVVDHAFPAEAGPEITVPLAAMFTDFRRNAAAAVAAATGRLR